MRPLIRCSHLRPARCFPWSAVALLVLGVVVFIRPAWAADALPSRSAAPSDWLSNVVASHGLGLGLLAVFIGGLALNLTPCVYPMIPVTLAFFSGQGAGSLRRTVALASAYVAGISLNYALLGVAAAKTGVLFGSWLQQPAVLVGVAVVIVALSLSMFGLYDLRLPSALTQRVGRASAGLWGAFVMGLVVGLVAAPCIGPFVLGLLLLVSHLANPIAGFLLFFMLGLGMGLPYVVLGVTAQRVGQLPKAGAWLVWSKKVLGCVLVGLALYFIRPLVPKPLLRVAIAALSLGAGVYLGWLERSEGDGRGFARARWMVGSALVLAGIMLSWPRPQTATGGQAVSWVPYSERALEQAQHDHQPILVDVYADWCLPCVEMDHVTFRNPEVARLLASVTTLRVDATREISPDGERLLGRFGIYGAPTILFFDRTGSERAELRLEGFATPDEFLQRLKRIL